MRARTVLSAVVLLLAAAAGAKAADVRHFSFAYDQPHTTAYGIAADTFGKKLEELSKGAMVIDQLPGSRKSPFFASAGLTRVSRRSGIQKSGAKPGAIPINSFGSTPTTVTGKSPRTIFCPTIAWSPPRWLCQKR